MERQEHEALGPARRSAAPTTDTAYAEDDLPAGAVDYEDDPGALYDDEVEYDEEPVASAPVAEPEAPVAPPAPAEGDRERHERFEREPSDDAAEVVDDLEPVDEDDLEPPPSAVPSAPGSEPRWTRHSATRWPRATPSASPD